MYVKDFRGEDILAVNAYKISGKYYEKNKHCFLVNGLWYRYNVPSIIYDHYTKQYRHISEKNKMYHGLVTYEGKFGYFSPNPDVVPIRLLRTDAPADATEIYDGNKKWYGACALNDKVINKSFTESFWDGIFYKTMDMTPEEHHQCLVKGLPKHEKVTGVYNLDDDLDTKEQLIDSYNNTTFELGKESRKFAKKIPYTWGIETETIAGFIPDRIRSRLGLRVLRDGSVNVSGTETVTIPLQGAKGIESMKIMYQELRKRCDIDYSCSTHIHFGNTRKDKAYILSLYKLCYLIQDELVKCFPIGRQQNRNGGKQYCQKLPHLDLNTKQLFRHRDRETYNANLVLEFNKIYAFLNNYPAGHVYDSVLTKLKKKIKNKVYIRNHYTKKCYSTKNKYSSHNGLPKYDIKNRYYWINFLPLLFAKQETVEFRLAEGSLNFTKSFNWLCLCVAILEYAKDVKTVLTLDNILISTIIKNHFKDEIGDYLVAYWRERRTTFTDVTGAYRANGADIEDKYYNKDTTFEFNYNGIKNIV